MGTTLQRGVWVPANRSKERRPPGVFIYSVPDSSQKFDATQESKLVEVKLNKRSKDDGGSSGGSILLLLFRCFGQTTAAKFYTEKKKKLHLSQQ